MNFRILLAVSAFLLAPSLYGTIITVENVAPYTISVQSLSNADEWINVSSGKSVRLNSWFKKVHGLTWAQGASSSGSRDRGCVYYFVKLDPSRLATSGNFFISKNGSYRTDMLASGGGVVAPFSSDKGCTSFGLNK
jgi:hypothetical protein